MRKKIIREKQTLENGKALSKHAKGPRPVPFSATISFQHMVSHAGSGPACMPATYPTLAHRAAVKWAMETRVTGGHMVTLGRTHLLITGLLAWLVSGGVSIRGAWTIPTGWLQMSLKLSCWLSAYLSSHTNRKWSNPTKYISKNTLKVFCKMYTMENPESMERNKEEN